MSESELPSALPVTGKSDVILFIQEMLIDVFGIVIPGFCLIVLALAGLVVPLIDLGKELGGSLEHIDGMHALAVGKTNTLLITLLFFSFVVGHLLYRQDPKRPDFRSIKRCWNEIKESGCVRSPQTDCWEYPYGHLEAYLKDRGFTELVETVTWPGEPFTKPPLERTEEEKSKVRKRSKHFINRIKLSVKHANSRLLLPLLVLILALVVRYTITRFFHYQRVREIVFVLQAWHLTKEASGASAPGAQTSAGR
jgi:hypothetical protein